ncbi:MAG: MotA/TolQ/ExbB proton channel family protein [Parachlamydiaceae bacterium]|nr:MotA/TolQ/ExbB proton channel family protein [Parachlamydiaceae bacterium]
MYVNIIILTSNPFFEAYTQSDLLGKFIFLSLYALSIGSWVVLVQKLWMTYQAKKNAFRFYESFQLQKFNPLTLDCESILKKDPLNPYLDLYQVLKKQSLDLLAKNKHFTKIQLEEEQGYTHQMIPPSSLSLNDIDFVASHLSTQVANQVKQLERHLYILATTVTLAPFLGLLGTVWGILTTFSEMQSQSSGSTHQMVLGGLSLALATTVLGLLDAIPALIGYNYLKNSIRNFTTEMEGFSNEILAAVELQYRKVDI